MAEPFQFDGKPLGDDVVLLAFRGEEALSTPYRYRVLVSLPTDSLPVAADVVGVTATLTIQSDPDLEAEQVHGVIANLQVLDPTGERSLVLVTLHPRLWQLGLTRHNRIFTETPVPDIVTKVLEANGWSDGTDFELKLDHSYDDQAHVCQYKESDLDFIARWLEREGMYYFFDQSAESDKLIITDHRSFHQAGPNKAVRYYPVTDPSADPIRGVFERFVSRKRVLPKTVRAVDYDYAHPTLELSADEDVAEGSDGVVIDHGARFWTPKEGKRLAKLKKEELLAQQQTFEGEGNVARLRPGYLFEVSKHPRDCFNKEFLCTATERHGNLRGKSAGVRRALGIEDDEVYRVTFKAIVGALQYRHEQATPRPRIHGFERATIDGAAASDYAQIDDDGCYQVRFAFDEEDNADASASTAVRMMQPHAGNPEGWHLPLRKGTEVLIAFVGGDPDRPLIAGAVPNAETASPVTSSNHTRNVFITGGENWLEIEDQEDAQWIDFRTPTQDTFLHLGEPHIPTHYIVGHTDADCLFDIGTDQKILVGGKLTEEVTKSVTETYNTSQTSTITGTQTTKVSKDVIEKYTGGQKTEVTGGVTELYLSGQKTTVAGGRSETYDSQQGSTVLAGVTQNINAGQDLTVNGPSVQVYTGSKASQASGATKYQFDASVVQLFGPVTELHVKTDWTVTGAANFFTSKWDLLLCNSREQSAAMTIIKGMLSNLTGVALGAHLLKYEATGFALGITGLKRERTGLTAEAFGGKFTATIATVDTSGIKSELAGVNGK